MTRGVRRLVTRGERARRKEERKRGLWQHYAQWLEPTAKAVWDEVAPGVPNGLTPRKAQLLALYCLAVSRHRELARISLAKMKRRSKLWERDLEAEHAAAMTALDIACQLRMTPLSRNRARAFRPHSVS